VIGLMPVSEFLCRSKVDSCQFGSQPSGVPNYSRPVLAMRGRMRDGAVTVQQ
jgi:hypothetical protein